MTTTSLRERWAGVFGSDTPEEAAEAAATLTEDIEREGVQPDPEPEPEPEASTPTFEVISIGPAGSKKNPNPDRTKAELHAEVDGEFVRVLVYTGSKGIAQGVISALQTLAS